jgi:hypothetical protein
MRRLHGPVYGHRVCIVVILSFVAYGCERYLTLREKLKSKPGTREGKGRFLVISIKSV